MSQKLSIFMSKVFGFKKTTFCQNILGKLKSLCALCKSKGKFSSFRHSSFTFSSVKLELATKLTRWCQIMFHLKRY